ncbi:MAG: mechanosensitive ion channel [Proteobacteria bacterium]|nr:mechanosensitive ion channel [Pseudomonadota bacterium]
MKSFEALFEQVSSFLPNLLSGLLVVILFLIIWFVVRKALARLKSYLGGQGYIAKLISKTISVAIIAIGLIASLDAFGINIFGLVAGLGLTGFAIGFALKDVMANIASGILLMLYKPFAIGDEVEALGITGKVISIDVRYTKLKYEDKIILLPNSKLITERVVINKSAKS